MGSGRLPHFDLWFLFASRAEGPEGGEPEWASERGDGSLM